MFNGDPNLLIATYLSVLLFLVSGARNRRVDLSDIGPVGAVFFASFNLLPAYRIFKFAADALDGAAKVPPELHGDEKYIAAAGLMSLLITIVGIFTCFRKAWEIPPHS